MKTNTWQKIKKAIADASREMKRIVSTKEGWIAWFIANMVFSATWYVPVAIGYIFDLPEVLSLGVSIFLIQWAPPPIETVFVFFLTVFFYKWLFAKKHVEKSR